MKPGLFLSRQIAVLTVLLIYTGFTPAVALAEMPSDSRAVYSVAEQEDEDFFEITVFFNVPRIGGVELPALVYGEAVYLSVTDLFNFLKIKTETSAGFDIIEGFFITEQSSYKIDRVNNKIDFGRRSFNLKPGDLVRTETNLYLKLNYFGDIFGLFCSFNFRSLTVTMNTTVELPIIREMRLEQMRKNISQIRGEIETDTIIGRRYPFFRFGAVDWMATSVQTSEGAFNTRLSTNIGTVIAGGEANIFLNFDSGTPFRHRDQYYHWRYANNDLKALRQVTLGKIQAMSTATLNSPVLGIELTNTPTTYRRSYGTYTLSDVTEPGWMVELYVNNVLIDYTRADASGFFSFEVPLVYGNTGVRLQFYGPWGEERSLEKNISVPFNFLPVGNFEYKVTGGVLEDSLDTKFSRAGFDFGLTNFMTIGGGVEYLSSMEPGKEFMPFATASLRLAPSLLLSGEYTHQIKMRGNLSYRLPFDLQLEANYVKYDREQTAIRSSYLEERKVMISVPIRGKNVSLFSRLSFNQFVLTNSQYSSTELLLSGSLFGISTNLTTNAIFLANSQTDIYSTLNLSFRSRKGLIFTPQVQYNYSRAEIVSLRGTLERQIFKKGFFNMSVEHNFFANFTNIEGGLRFDLSFGRIGASVRRGGNTTTYTQTAGGSIITDAKGKYLGASMRTNVGRGGVVIHPFLDINGNGVRDNDEPAVYGMEIQVHGGRTKYNDRDGSIRVFELEPYTNYLVTLLETKFDNIAWRLDNRTLKVAIDPNQFKHIQAPVSVVGEAAGMVYMRRGGVDRPQGRIIINYYKKDSTLVKSVLSEEDGFFSHLGFRPGEYFATVDKDQMTRLNMKAYPARIDFVIEGNIDGDYLDDLMFIIESGETREQESDKTTESKPGVKTETITETRTTTDQHTVQQPARVEQPADSSATLYRVQILALHNNRGIYEHLLPLLVRIKGLVITETYSADRFYRYSAGSFKTRTEAIALLRLIRAYGWPEAYIVPYTLREEAKIKTNTIIYIPEKAIFGIQLCALRNRLDINEHFGKVTEELPGVEITEERGNDGLYRYSAGRFSSRAEAQSALRVIRRLGWSDSFITSVVVARE